LRKCCAGEEGLGSFVDTSVEAIACGKDVNPTVLLDRRHWVLAHVPHTKDFLTILPASARVGFNEGTECPVMASRGWRRRGKRGEREGEKRGTAEAPPCSVKNALAELGHSGVRT
jgi:hypothetical protein